ncbi:MAG TPA: hypothetical protein VGG78_01370, partial [Gemmatimonadaceae bacterium]
MRVRGTTGTTTETAAGTAAGTTAASRAEATPGPTNGATNVATPVTLLGPSLLATDAGAAADTTAGATATSLWHAYTVVVAAACVMIGVYWDISWHMSIGR